MKIFLSYGHDSNASLIEKIKEYLSKDADGDLMYEVWIDTSEIKAEFHELRICSVLSLEMTENYHYGKM